MKRKHTAAYTDYIYTLKEFHNDYLVGCLIKMSNRQAIVRERGPVTDLSKVVMRKKKRSQ